MDMQVQEHVDVARPLAGRVAVVTGSTSGIGLGIARALAQAGADVVINGLGEQREIELVCAELDAICPRSRVVYNGANLMKGDEADRPGRGDDRRVRPGRHPRQQRRDPARQPDRELPAREVRGDHRPQPVGGLVHHPRRLRRDEAERLRPDHQRRVGPRPRRLAVQERLCRRQAWRDRPDQDGRARRRRARHHLQRHLPRLRLDAAGREPDRRHRQGARDHAASKSSATSCSPPSRTSASPKSRSWARSRCSCAAPAAARSPAPRCRSTAAGRRTEHCREDRKQSSARRHRRRRLRRACRCEAARRPRRRRDRRRPAQPSRVSAVAVPGRDRRAVAGRHRRADPRDLFALPATFA